ncbi:hypothetical protein Dsin_007435 [Dipteronia sinensis]|uniref:Uncharacterized protein n=1 Tax=Dipteronia sinensis TaxID=43782 RepID=A0AAE0EGG9_9ROSI|nr:hypothetical protein Dsin_007435 [Dipteronia sinensis]
MPAMDATVVQDIILASAIAFACLQSEPKSRPTMKYVSQKFLARKTLMSRTPLHKISVAELKQQDLYFVDEINSSYIIDVHILDEVMLPTELQVISDDWQVSEAIKIPLSFHQFNHS